MVYKYWSRHIQKMQSNNAFPKLFVHTRARNGRTCKVRRTGAFQYQERKVCSTLRQYWCNIFECCMLRIYSLIDFNGFYLEIAFNCAFAPPSSTATTTLELLSCPPFVVSFYFHSKLHWYLYTTQHNFINIFILENFSWRCDLHLYNLRANAIELDQ